MNEIIVKGMELLSAAAGNGLLVVMLAAFIIGGISRALVYFTVSREHWFVLEFEKRLIRLMDFEKYHGPMSFYVLVKRLLHKTFYEIFEVRSVMRRRKIDHIMAPADRIFLVQPGCAYLVRDTLKRSKQLKFNEEGFEELKEMSSQVLATNACFSRLLGIFPLGPVNEVLDKLPGLFIVMGIFGTFLGIMNALPELGGMDLNDAVGTKVIMDNFLGKVSHSMVTSALGILMMILFQIYNALLNPERLFMEVVEKFHNTMTHLWRRCDSNAAPEGLPEFDEHKDPVEALAELALQKELNTLDQKSKVARPRESVAPPPVNPHVASQMQTMQQYQKPKSGGDGGTDSSGNKVA